MLYRLLIFPVMSDTYESAFGKAINELTVAMEAREKLETEREAIDRKIVKLREGVIGLGTLCGYNRAAVIANFRELFPNLIDPDVGITDVVRKVLSVEKNYYLTPVQIKEKLAASGYDISNQKNILASLHTILKRLKAQGQVVTGTRDGKTVYKWKPGAPAPANDTSPNVLQDAVRKFAANRQTSDSLRRLAEEAKKEKKS